MKMKNLYEVVYGGGDEAVRAATDLAGTSQWILYADRKPSRERRVIVCRHYPDGRRYVDVIVWFHDDECGLPPSPTFECITHWMPLPEPPAGDESQ